MASVCTTTTLTLTDFLLARIEEDEEAARDAAGWDRSGRVRASGQWVRHGIASINTDDGQSVLYSDHNQANASATDHMARHDPARVLAECEAKRRILDIALIGAAIADPSQRDAGRLEGIVCTLRTLAEPYANHDDYDEAWRP